ncbi:MAG: glycosyltransferase family 4 protein [Candidatus Bathyarchaeia archaeon]
MKIGVIHRNVATTKGLVGGGDVFLVYLLRALKEKGHTVTLLTTKPTRWDVIERDLGWVFKPDVEGRSSLLPSLEVAGLYRQFLPPLPVLWLKHKCDVTFDSYGRNLFWNTDIIYIHTPPTREELSTKYNRNNLTKTYYNIYRAIAGRLKRGLKTRILTNSEYSKEIISATTGLEARVVYPPVDVKLYRALINCDGLRKNWVATVSRFTAEKRLELIPEIAERVRDAVFHIVGTTPSKQTSSTVIESIKKRSQELGVTGRVKLHINTSFDEKMAVLAASKVYLHTTRDEHFGMAIAEAMSGGLAPIVPDEGGQKEIVPCKDFTYRNLEEAAQKVEYWLNNWSRESALYFAKSAERFSFERFREEIDSIIREVATSKLRG